jgi:ABC-type amino acid transport substrate-binding protein
LAIAFIAAGASLAARERVTVAAFEYPPIYENGSRKGLSGDIVVAAFDAAGVDAELRFLPVARMVRAVSDGEAVCGIGGKILFAGPDVLPNVREGPVIQYVAQVFMFDARKYPKGIAYSKLSDMSGYRIGVLNGSGIMKILEREPTLTLAANTIHEGSAKQLAAGRIDAWAIVDLTGIMYAKRLFPDEAAHYAYSEPFNLGDVSVLFSKKADPDGRMGRLFEQGLETIKKNGTYMRIMARYYGSAHAINRYALTPDMR